MPVTSPTSHQKMGSVRGRSKLRQRGIFSETIAVSDPESEYESKSDMLAYAPKAEKVNIQPLPNASSFVSSGVKKKKAGSPSSKNTLFASSLKKDDAFAAYPTSAYEPKVSLPYESLPGQPPRNIEIQRKKRLYSSHKIEDLLRAEGVDLEDPVDLERAMG